MLSPKEFIEDAVQKIKDQIGDEKAIIAKNTITITSAKPILPNH